MVNKREDCLFFIVNKYLDDLNEFQPNVCHQALRLNAEKISIRTIINSDRS